MATTTRSLTKLLITWRKTIGKQCVQITETIKIWNVNVQSRHILTQVCKWRKRAYQQTHRTKNKTFNSFTFKVKPMWYQDVLRNDGGRGELRLGYKGKRTWRVEVHERTQSFVLPVRALLELRSLITSVGSLRTSLFDNGSDPVTFCGRLGSERV